MKLFVDDIRDIDSAYGFIVARSYDEAIEIISGNSFETISLDYNLGYNSLTGFDILKYIVENKIKVNHINVHSDHPEGKRLMRRYANKHNLKLTFNAV